jgi:hypothetical protein
MKKVILIFALVIGFVLNMNGQGWYSNSGNSSGSSYKTSATASLTIMNRSSYTLTVKIMKTGGRGLYQTVSISPKSSSTVSFYSSDTFFTKTKASKGLETFYKKSGVFSIQCDEEGYSQATLEFFVSSGGGGTGQGISKAEFESNK